MENWRVYEDDAAEPTSALANENTRPTLANLNLIRMRMNCSNVVGGGGYSTIGKLRYTTDITETEYNAADYEPDNGSETNPWTKSTEGTYSSARVSDADCINGYRLTIDTPTSGADNQLLYAHAGNPWDAGIDNTRGYVINARLKVVDSGTDGAQSIIIFDGTRFSRVDFYTDKVVIPALVISETDQEYLVDTTADYLTYAIEIKGDEIIVRVSQTRRLSGTLDSSTSASAFYFGDGSGGADKGGEVHWDYINYHLYPWVEVDSTGAHWDYGSGKGAGGTDIAGYLLTDSGVKEHYCTSAAYVNNLQLYNGTTEFDICLQQTGAASFEETYYFRLSDDIGYYLRYFILESGKTYPQVISAADPDVTVTVSTLTLTASLIAAVGEGLMVIAVATLSLIANIIKPGVTKTRGYYDPVVKGGCPQCGTYMYGNKRIRSMAVKFGRHKDGTAKDDDKHVRCARCGFMCHRDTDAHAPEGSKRGWGIESEAAETDAEEI